MPDHRMDTLPVVESPVRFGNLACQMSVSLIRSGVLLPEIGDADVNMVDFCEKIGISVRNLPM